MKLFSKKTTLLLKLCYAKQAINLHCLALFVLILDPPLLKPFQMITNL